MAADIDEQSSPRKARLIFDSDGWDCETVGRDLNKLEKGLQPVKRP